MIAAWMLYGVASGAALSAAAAAADGFAAARRRPRRFIWAAALAATALWPATAALVPRSSASGSAGARPDAVGAFRLPPVAVPAIGGVSTGALDTALLALWGGASAALLIRLVAAGAAVRRWRRTWPARDVDGVHVRVAPDLGPAVVGLRRMELVLPAWALALGRGEREFVLRHEAEHRAARDPYLLLLAAVLTALVPWHPALWWQARRLRLAVEFDCDARVLRADPHPARYARLLLQIAQSRGANALRLAPALAGLAAFPTHLERRIVAMHPPARPTSRVRPVALGAATLAAVAVACAVESPTRPNTAAARTTAPKPAAPNVAAQPYFEFQVEEPATLLAPPDVRYPAALRTAEGGGITGDVLAQFVVDTTGRVDPATAKVLRSTHPAFTAAILAVLPALAFHPARAGGRAVKQLVQLPFRFTPRR